MRVFKPEIGLKCVCALGPLDSSGGLENTTEKQILVDCQDSPHCMDATKQV